MTFGEMQMRFPLRTAIRIRLILPQYPQSPFSSSPGVSGSLELAKMDDKEDEKKELEMLEGLSGPHLLPNSMMGVQDAPEDGNYTHSSEHSSLSLNEDIHSSMDFQDILDLNPQELLPSGQRAISDHHEKFQGDAVTGFSHPQPPLLYDPQYLPDVSNNCPPGQNFQEVSAVGYPTAFTSSLVDGSHPPSGVQGTSSSYSQTSLVSSFPDASNGSPQSYLYTPPASESIQGFPAEGCSNPPSLDQVGSHFPETSPENFQVESPMDWNQICASTIPEDGKEEFERVLGDVGAVGVQNETPDEEMSGFIEYRLPAYLPVPQDPHLPYPERLQGSVEIPLVPEMPAVFPPVPEESLVDPLRLAGQHRHLSPQVCPEERLPPTAHQQATVEQMEERVNNPLPATRPKSHICYATTCLHRHQKPAARPEQQPPTVQLRLQTNSKLKSLFEKRSKGVASTSTNQTAGQQASATHLSLQTTSQLKSLLSKRSKGVVSTSTNPTAARQTSTALLEQPRATLTIQWRVLTTSEFETSKSSATQITVEQTSSESSSKPVPRKRLGEMVCSLPEAIKASPSGSCPSESCPSDSQGTNKSRDNCVPPQATPSKAIDFVENRIKEGRARRQAEDKAMMDRFMKGMRNAQPKSVEVRSPLPVEPKKLATYPILKGILEKPPLTPTVQVKDQGAEAMMSRLHVGFNKQATHPTLMGILEKTPPVLEVNDQETADLLQKETDEILMNQLMDFVFQDKNTKVAEGKEQTEVSRKNREVTQKVIEYVFQEGMHSSLGRTEEAEEPVGLNEDQLESLVFEAANKMLEATEPEESFREISKGSSYYTPILTPLTPEVRTDVVEEFLAKKKRLQIGDPSSLPTKDPLKVKELSRTSRIPTTPLLFFKELLRLRLKFKQFKDTVGKELSRQRAMYAINEPKNAKQLTWITASLLAMEDVLSELDEEMAAREKGKSHNMSIYHFGTDTFDILMRSAKWIIGGVGQWKSVTFLDPPFPQMEEEFFPRHEEMQTFLEQGKLSTPTVCVWQDPKWKDHTKGLLRLVYREEADVETVYSHLAAFRQETINCL